MKLSGNKFQQRHYEAIAKTIADLRAKLDRGFVHGEGGYGWEHITPRVAVTEVECELANMLAADNPRFKPERFHAACNPEGS